MVKLIIIFLIVFTSAAQGFYSEQDYNTMVEIAREYNDKSVFYSRLSYPDEVMTEEQLHNRVSWLLEYSEGLNYMYPEIDEMGFAIALFGVIQHETGFVNYADLDNGYSFGVISMLQSTAKEIADDFGHSFNRTEITQNVERQIKYAAYYLYRSLKRYNCIDKAILSYNVGYVRSHQGFTNYYYLVKKHIDNLEKELGY